MIHPDPGRFAVKPFPCLFYTSVVELSDKKEQVTAEDLPYIIADVLRYDPVDTPVRILNYSLSLAQGMSASETEK